MNLSRPADRRGFIAFSLTGIALLMSRPVLAPPRRAARAGPAPAADDRLARRLAGLLPHQASAASVGRVYLQQWPHETHAPTLARRIVESLAIGERAAHRADDVTLRRLIEQRIRDDFADGRTVRVDGWVLAQTEARLFAATALARPG